MTRLEKTAKFDVKAKAELDVMHRCKAHLEQGKNIRELGLDKEEALALALADLFY